MAYKNFFKERSMYLEVVFFSSSNINRGERHPIASHGEILHEKLAPYMLLVSSLDLGGCALHSAANFWSLCIASVSPPTREALAAGFPS